MTMTKIETLLGDALIKANAVTALDDGVTAGQVVGDALDSKAAKIAYKLAAPVVLGTCSARKSCDDADIAWSTGQRLVAMGTALLALPVGKRTNAFAKVLDETKAFRKVRDGREALTSTEVRAALRKFDGRSADVLVSLIVEAATAKATRHAVTQEANRKAAEAQAIADATEEGQKAKAEAEAAKANAKALSPREAVASQLAAALTACEALLGHANLSDLAAIDEATMTGLDLLSERVKALAAVNVAARRIATKAAKVAEAAEAKAAKATADATAKAEADAVALSEAVAATVASDAEALAS